MKSKKIFILAVLLVAIMTFGGITVFADTFVPPEPFEIWSEDETMVFRWNPIMDELGSQRMAQAGMYKDGELVWSVDNLPTMGESARSFYFSDDFRFMVFIPGVDQIVALGFFENGALFRSYRIDELVRDMSVVTYTVTMAWWENWAYRYFDTTNNTLTIVTRDEITYIFDITTGEIIYDTAGDTPFIPHREDSWGFFVQESPLPLWTQKPSNDTPSSWAQESIERAGELGLLPDPFRYGFGRSITRAEFAAIAITLYEYFREPVTGRITFTDTADINVEKAAYLGIVSGVGNNRFNPDSPLTREQAAVILSRLVVLLGGEVGVLASPSFYDVNDISDWAINAVRHMEILDIMSGVGYNRFAPHSPCTREQSIIAIMRVFDLLNDEGI